MHSYRLLDTVQMKGDGPLSVKQSWDEHTKRRFEELESDYLRDCPKEIMFKSDIGFPGDTIVSYVDHNRVDLVVMGASGEGPWKRVFGSTTRRVVDKVRCPILIVPPGMRYKGFNKALLAYDFEQIENPHMFEMLLELVSGSLGSLEVLNVNNTNRITESELEGEPFPLKKHIESVPHTFTFVSHESVPGGISQHVKDTQPDLFVLIKKEHKLLDQLLSGSVTHKVLESIDVPVMVLHE